MGSSQIWRISKSSGHSPTSHKPKRLNKRRQAKLMSSSDLYSESDSESGHNSEAGSMASSKGSMSDRQYDRNP